VAGVARRGHEHRSAGPLDHRVGQRRSEQVAQAQGGAEPGQDDRRRLDSHPGIADHGGQREADRDHERSPDDAQHEVLA
jgi:hypothetical protein